MTLDGAPWYHNEGTGEVSWDQPTALWCNDPNMHDDGNWVWVPDEKLGFITAQKLSGTSESGFAVKLENGMRTHIPAGAKVFPLARSSLIRLEQDLVMLDALDEGMICHTLRNRFQADAFYTAVGTILVAINPFQYLPVYGPETMREYHRPGNRQLPPHVFQIAASSHKSMSLDGANQVCLLA